MPGSQRLPFHPPRLEGQGASSESEQHLTIEEMAFHFQLLSFVANRCVQASVKDRCPSDSVNENPRDWSDS